MAFYAFHFAPSRLSAEDVPGGRYYVSPIIQDADGYRAAFHDLNHRAVLATGPTGVPLLDWALIYVSAVIHAPILLDAGVYPLPAQPLTTPIASLSPPERGLLAAVESRTGVVIQSAATLGEAVDRLGAAQAGDSFDANAMNVVGDEAVA